MSPQLQATQTDQPSDIQDRSRSTTPSAYKRPRKMSPASRRVRQLLEASREDSRMVVNAMQEMSQNMLKGFGDIIKSVVNINNPMFQFQSQHASYNHGFSQPFANVPSMTPMMNMSVSQHVASETQNTTTPSYFDLLSKSSDLVD